MQMNPDSTTPQAPVAPKAAGSAWKTVFKEIFVFILIAVGIVLPFRALIAEPYIVQGASMDPTFATGDYLIVDKFSYKLGEPERNSVVVFKFPTELSRNLIKRIIGIPGDTVSMDKNTITITNTDNPTGFVLDQSYITHPSQESFTITLADDEYLVLGDNRPASYDSRQWGILPRKDILGRPVLRLLPMSKIGILPGDASEEVMQK